MASFGPGSLSQLGASLSAAAASFNQNSLPRETLLTSLSSLGSNVQHLATSTQESVSKALREGAGGVDALAVQHLVQALKRAEQCNEETARYAQCLASQLEFRGGADATL